MMGSVEAEKYCLKWNDFTLNLSSAFNELRDDEDFFDITLLTEESEIRCHKLILGACSPHFRAIIKRLSAIQNPAIYLRGVRHEDIKNILEFMYLGEVSVSQADLDSFLSVAQDLCIKGLTQQDSSSSQNRSQSSTPSGGTQHRFKRELNPVTQPSNTFQNQQGGGPPPTKKPRQNLPNKNGDNAGASSSGASPIIPQTKREPKPEIHEEIEVLDDDDPSQLEVEEYEDYYDDPGPSGSGANAGAGGDLEDDSQGYFEDNSNSGQGAELGLVNLADGTAMCLRCNKSFSSPAQAKIHFKEVHATDKNDRKFPCAICHKSFAVKRYLNNHIRSQHGLTPKLLQQNYVPS